MRPFGPHRLVLRADAAVDDDLARPDERTGLQVEALNPDRAMPLIARRAFGRPVVDQPRAAVRIDEQRRVDPVEIEPVRRGPRPGRVARGAIEIAAAREDRKSKRLNSSHYCATRMPSSA